MGEGSVERGGCKKVLGDVRERVGEGMGKCGERYGKVCWGVEGDVGKCRGRCKKVCWGVRRDVESGGRVWRSVLGCGGR